MDKELMKNYALKYAEEYGLAVFPLGYKSKKPLMKGGFKNATTDPETIKEWWTEKPFANIGCACGKASGGLVVIDLDVDEEKGIDGYTSLRQWEHENGELPDTADVLTGRGGYHLYYKSVVPMGSRIALLDGVDVRAEGGYTVLPPSIHPNGNQYDWEQNPDDIPFAECDEVVYQLLSLGDPKESDESKSFKMPTTIPMGNRNGTLYKLACSLQAKGLADDVIRSTVHKVNQEQCEEPVEDDELDKTIDSALSKDKGNLRIVDDIKAIKPDDIKFDMKMTKNGPVIKQTIDNMVIAMQQDENLAGRVCWNDFNHAPFRVGKLPWTHPEDDFEAQWLDADDSNMERYLEHQYGLNSERKYLQAFNIVTDANKYHPVREWFSRLPEWKDGEDDDYISLLAPTFLGARGDRLDYEIIRMFMLGAINRVFRPGCQFDYVLTLVGDQGAGKSSFVRGMAFNSEWCDDNFSSIDGVKAQEKLMGRWIVEIAELLAMKRQKDVEATKAFLTSRVDSYRPPYGRRVVQIPRQCVFVATTNTNQFLSDKTGNRRFMPIQAHKDKRIEKMDLNNPWVEHFVKMAWAQAYYIFKAEDPPIYFNDGIEGELESRRETEYTEEDTRIGMIQEYLDSHPMDRVCAQMIWENCLNDGYTYPCPMKSAVEIHQIMKEEIDNWHFIGKQRIDGYGIQKAYESEVRLNKNNEWKLVKDKKW